MMHYSQMEPPDPLVAQVQIAEEQDAAQREYDTLRTFNARQRASARRFLAHPAAELRDHARAILAELAGQP